MGITKEACPTPEGVREGEDLMTDAVDIRCVSTPENVSVFTYELGKSSVADANQYPFEDDVWWVSRVLVYHKTRGKGLGSRLLQRLVEEVRGYGAKAVVVAPGGYGANHNKQIRFYEKNGFKEMDKDGLYRMEL